MTDRYSQEMPQLLQSHLDHLLSSAISLDVIKERGYQSIYGSDPLLAELGFTEKQRRRPAGILIPHYGVDGKIVGYEYRPDNPRTQYRQNGTPRKVKYETPAKEPNRLDIHPRLLKNIDDPKIYAFVTEGIKKVDSLVSAGAGLVIGLKGVWNFRGTNTKGGKVLLADWQYIACNDRTFYIVFDSDSATNPAVKAAREALTAILITKGAKVVIINLPGGPNGEKVGVDDYLAQGHTLTDLLELGQSAEEKVPVKKPQDGLFRRYDGLLYFINNGQPVELGTFDAKIIEIVEKDNGLDVEKYFRIIGSDYYHKPLPVVEIKASEFDSMNWVTEHWDVRAAISHDRAAKARMAEILKRDAFFNHPVAQRRRVFKHTGWREIDGKWYYLTSSGAVGNPDIRVDMEDNDLKLYALPEPPKDPAAALRASLDFLKLGNIQVLLPLWASMYMSPLNPFIDTNFSLMLVGGSGTVKSGISALALNHFGPDFDYNRFPASWRATDNRLERIMFTLKDAPTAADDWAPGSTEKKQKQLIEMIESIIRDQGNRRGRQRLKSDASVNTTYSPRGFFLTSAEQLPGGYSATARMYVVEMNKGDVNLPKYFAVAMDYDRRKLYSQAMSAFIVWISNNWDLLKTKLPEQVKSWTSQAMQINRDQHARLPGSVAKLYAGMITALSFFQESGAITAEEAMTLQKDGWDILTYWSTEQAGRVERERPGKRFIDALNALRNQGKIIFGTTQDDHPKHAELGEVVIGWRDQDDDIYYLNPSVAYAAIRDFLGRTDKPLTESEDYVWKDLREMGYTDCSVDTNKDGKTTLRTKYRKQIYGKVQWLIRLKKEVFQ